MVDTAVEPIAQPAVQSSGDASGSTDQHDPGGHRKEQEDASVPSNTAEKNASGRHCCGCCEFSFSGARRSAPLVVSQDGLLRVTPIRPNFCLPRW
jgi:hypothetical protein